MSNNKEKMDLSRLSKNIKEVIKENRKIINDMNFIFNSYINKTDLKISTSNSISEQFKIIKEFIEKLIAQINNRTPNDNLNDMQNINIQKYNELKKKYEDKKQNYDNLLNQYNKKNNELEEIKRNYDNLLNQDKKNKELKKNYEEIKRNYDNLLNLDKQKYNEL